MARQKWFNIRVNDEDREILETAARNSGYSSVSTFIRAAAVAAAQSQSQPHPPENGQPQRGRRRD